MNLIACNGTWATLQDNSVTCSGTLQVVSGDSLIPQGMTIDDVNQLTGSALELFAIVFGFLVLKKALN
jgi:hypothetical protein